MIHTSRISPRPGRWMTAACVLVAISASPLVAQDTGRIIRAEPDGIDVPDFDGYEVEYTSAFGRFFNRVQPFDVDGAGKISVLNLIEMPDGVIVDSKSIDRATLRLDYFMSPFFAWGQEYIVSQWTAEGMEWNRIPLGGGEAIRVVAESEHGGFMDDLGFSPTLAAVMPLPIGTRFQMPGLRYGTDGSVAERLVDYEVVGRESLSLESGVACDCWVIDQTDAAGATHRFWVSREAPFVFKRARNFGEPQEFVSEVLHFRHH